MKEEKTCCCISYERGITPCQCGCHNVWKKEKESQDYMRECCGEKISFTTKGKSPFTDGNLSEPKTNWESKFWEIVEAEGNGADIDFVRHLRKFTASQREEAYEEGRKTDNQVPMGVSQWRNHGEKYGYDKFFENKTKKELLSDIEKWVEDKIGKTTTQYGLGYEAAQEDLFKFLESLK